MDNNSPSKVTFLDLPYDTMGEIFYFLLSNTQDFFTIFFLSKEISDVVCRYSDEINFHLKTIKIIPTCERIILSVKNLVVDVKCGNYELFSLLKIFKNLRKLIFNEITVVDDDLMKNLTTFSIRSLKIMGKSKITDKGMSCIPSSLCEFEMLGMAINEDRGISDVGFRYLSKLRIKKFVITALGVKISEKALLKFQKFIKELNLSGQKNISKDGFRNVLINSVIEKLDVSKTNISDFCLSFLPESIRILNICGCENITDDGIVFLKNLKINYLYISGLFVTEQGFSHIPKTVKTLICGVDINDEYLEEISKLKIRNLDLSFCNLITNLGLSFLPVSITKLEMSNVEISSLEWIVNCDQIRILDLSRCLYLNDEGLKKLSKFKRLRELDISFCLITNKGLSFIPMNLRKLNMWKTRKNENVVQLNFLEKFRSLEILNISAPLKFENITFLPQTIIELKLNDNINDELLKCLNLKNLTKLVVKNNRKISEMGVLSILGKLKKLNRVYFSECRKLEFLSKNSIRGKFKRKIVLRNNWT